MRARRVATAAVVTATILGGCSPSTTAISGEVSTFGAIGDCSGTNRRTTQQFAGEQVTVKDGDGSVIGTDQMEMLDPIDDRAAGGAICLVRGAYSLEVEVADFYVIEVAGYPALEPISKDELEQMDGTVDVEVSD